MDTTGLGLYYGNQSGSNSYVKITPKLIELGSDGNLNITTNNVIIHTNATSSNSIFEIKNGNTSYLKYSL